MRKYLLEIKIYLLLLLLFMTSCNGQINPNGSGQPKSIEKEQPRIIRTKGTANENVVCELEDKDGNLWFSIQGEGAYRYDGQAFTNFTTEDGLCNNNVTAIIQNKTGNILFGMNKGICKYDGKGFTRYPEMDTLHITCLLEDRDGVLWFGTMGNGVYRYDGKTLTNFLSNKDHVFNFTNHNQLILDILQDRNGNLWFTSWNGGGVWKYDGKTFSNFRPSDGYYKTNEDKRNLTYSPSFIPGSTYIHTSDYISDDMIFSVAEDKAGNIWFATRDHGACRYDGKAFTNFWTKEGFLSRGAYAILEDRKGNLWFTTEKEGVWSYDGKSLKNFTVKDGLVNNAVLSMLEDQNGNIWFGTKWFGLSRYDGTRFTTFSEYEPNQK